jgi:hypothetical protein
MKWASEEGRTKRDAKAVKAEVDTTVLGDNGRLTRVAPRWNLGLGLGRQILAQDSLTTRM